ncbi:hypothetical protein BKG97_05705 [Rodentibacter caecimuris]|nr:hypothetical protein BKG97_05705 [Rodentibacter heylii]
MGMGIAENVVEHNFFDVDSRQDSLDDIKLFAKLYFNDDEEKAEDYYEAMQQGKAKGFKDNVVETADAILNLDETVKSLAYAVKHDPALAGEMQGYILGNFGLI